MLKIVYPICCGMDVHKNSVVACIAATDDKGVTTCKKKRFSTFTSDLRRCAYYRQKNRAQNCLTVSNIKLDYVFSDVFGKTVSAITDRLLESNEPFDVAPYLSKRIKTPVEKIPAAVDGEIYAEQAEKLRIIRSHMNSLELCKANLESLILSTAPGLALRRRIMRAPERRKPPESAEPGLISNLCR